MRLLLIFIFLVCSLVSIAQTGSQNYVISRAYKQTGADANDIGKVNIQVQYLDGLGRASQSIAVGQATNGSDIIIPIEYDANGRQTKNYLPYAGGANGNFISSGSVAQAGFYSGNSAMLESSDLGRAYQETILESSPLGRPLSQQAPGNKSRSSNYIYGANGASEVTLYLYTAHADITQTITSSGNYVAGSLYRIETKDDENNTSIEFTDTYGRLICKRLIASATEALSTYYVYDDYGLLRGVLQPEYQTGSDASNYAFLYDYDGRGRVITKKVPGAGKIDFVYDKMDRQVMSQDANQLARGIWSFIKYDALDRAIVTGEFNSTASRTTHQVALDESTSYYEVKDGSSTGYTLSGAMPSVAEADVLSVVYYDNYSFPGNQAYNNLLSISANTAVKGKQTGNRTRILNSGANWLVSTIYYDLEYRPIQQIRQLYDLGSINIERVSNQYQYDLAPVVIQERTDHESSGTVTNSLIKVFEYDHGERILSVKEKVTVGSKSKEATTVAQRYNVLGQLQSKWFHAYAGNSTKFRRRTDYINNIRGWQTSASTVYQEIYSSDQTFFGYSISYSNPLYADQYSNGNISRIQWSGKDEESLTKGLNFTYDGANRLKTSTGIGGYADTESGIIYDLNGNIKKLIRAGAAVDNLTYSYLGNRMSAVSDASTSNTGVKTGTSSYAYDANGNMTSDGNRGTSLTYNFLNLPKTVVVGTKTFNYVYDASGIKHKYAGDTVNIKYAGPFEYNAANVAKRVTTSEGQLVPSGDTLRFDYYLKDHLGNVRVVWDESGQIIQRNDYYPFGLEIDRSTPAQTPAVRNGINRYNFLGKEAQVETGYIDLQARFYDPTIGRFSSIDPETEGQLEFSPYHYSFNNPIRFSDPDGRFPECCGGAIDFLTGVGQALTENIAGSSPIRVSPGYIESYNNGRTFGHAVSAVGGAFFTAKGAVDVGASGAALVVSGGTAAPLAVPGVIVGVGEMAIGINTISNAIDNLRNDKGRVEAHGNKLDDKPAEGYSLRDRKTGEVKKYGETTRGEDKFGSGKQKRYSKKDLKSKDVDYVKEKSGTKKEMHKWQTERIRDHKSKNDNKRPDLNKTDY